MLQIYDFETGEDVLEDDYEARLETKLNVSYKDYQVAQGDMFNGYETILCGENSEKAALATCRAIYKSLKRKNVERWTDDDFGPQTTFNVFSED